MTKTCHCLFNHPQTTEERAEVVAALEYARSIGDVQAFPILIAQLTGPCPAWTTAPTQDSEEL